MLCVTEKGMISIDPMDASKKKREKKGKRKVSQRSKKRVIHNNISEEHVTEKQTKLATSMCTHLV